MRELFAVDLGTTKFVIAKFSMNKEGSPSFQTVTIESKGMKRGMIADFEEARTQLNCLLEVAEQKFSVDIRSVVVGIAGNHLRGKLIKTKIPISGQIINESHLKLVSEQLKEIEVDHERETLHSIPLSYKVDGREWIRNPIGFSGHSLLCEAFHITSEKSYLIDIVRLFNSIGIQIDSLYAEPYASALVTIGDKEREEGIAIADIGGGTTDGIIFKHGLPVGLFSIAIAGKLFTSDIKILLEISNEKAEYYKTMFGLEGAYLAETEIGPERSSLLYKVLLARSDELFKVLSQVLKPYHSLIGSGLALTGGGCQLKGLVDRGMEKLDMKVFSINPVSPQKDMFSDLDSANAQNRNEALNFRFATVSGLMYLYILEKREDLDSSPTNNAINYIKNIWKWVKELS